MNGAVGDVLPLAIGVAISPVPIIAVILMLLAPRAGGTSMGFLAGWVTGIVVATAVFAIVANVSGLRSGGTPSPAVSWIKILLGVLMLALALKQWQGRPAPGAQAELPGWMRAIDTLTPAKGAGLGFALSAVNPKNLMMCVAAGISAAGAGSYVVPILIFTVVAGCTVAIPVIAYAAAAERMRAPLNDLRDWLEQNNATVMFVLLLVIGVVLLGKGIGGL